MKVTAPLFSLDASGSIGGAIVASKWKGRNYMRRLVTPSNPQSAAQTANRAMMQFLSQSWALIDPTIQASWEALAAQGNYSRFNAFTRKNLMRWTQWQYPWMAADGTPASTPGTITSINTTGEVGQISGSIGPANDGDEMWGVALYINGTNDLTIAKSELRLIVYDPTETAVDFVIPRVEPGTWYVKGLFFGVDGAAGTVQKSGATVVT